MSKIKSSIEFERLYGAHNTIRRIVSDFFKAASYEDVQVKIKDDNIVVIYEDKGTLNFETVKSLKKELSSYPFRAKLTGNHKSEAVN